MRKLSVLFPAVLLWTLFASFAQGQQDTTPAAPEDSSQRERLEARLADIERQQNLLEAIAARTPSDSSAVNNAQRNRLNQERIDLMSQQLAFARAVAGVREQADLFEEYADQARAYLDDNLRIATGAWGQLDQNAVYPDASLSAAEQTTANRRFFDNLRTVDRMITQASDSLEAMVTLDYNTDAARSTYLDSLQQRAVSLSIYLTLAQQQVVDKRAVSGTLPDDSDMAAQVNLAVARVNAIADSLRNAVNELDALDVDTGDFREQLVVTTGAITSDAFDTRILRDLVAGWSEQAIEYAINEGPDLVISVIVFLIVLIIAFKLSRVARRMMDRGLKRSKLRLSELLRRMIVSTAGNLVLVLGILFALAQIGISLGPLLAGLGIAGFIIGFALQDSLSNFASGMMILFYRPYDVGDVVELNGMAGKVELMSLVNTTIHTFDNQRIIMPNSMIWGGIIKNVTAQKIRRVDMVFGIAYSDDIEKAEAILKDIVTGHELVLGDPEPVIRLHELADSSVNFIVRPWTQTENYWLVYWDITRGVKLRFDREGISIPFPQRDVHLIQPPDQPPALLAVQSETATAEDRPAPKKSRNKGKGKARTRQPAQTETVEYPETDDTPGTDPR
ncbi:MAG: mechanosensitive ion channel [Gammaproteobacteria bacterium]|nr:mechanosensitive ion channel [Pseudomonadales bacterium]MCP5347117.1 mechanosensitive ion channel [Pseudomonadales bacterium]